MYASIWKRFFAFLIDAAIFAVLFWAVAHAAGSGTAAITLVVVIWLYYALLESSPMQASLGKIIAGIKVVDHRGRRLTFWQATERILSKLVTNLTFYFGFFMAAFDRRKQTLHDRISHSAVILKNADFDPDDFIEEEETSLTMVTIVSILLAIVFVSALLMTVSLPQYKHLANKAQASLVATQVAQIQAVQAERVQAGADSAVWNGEFENCQKLTPRILKCSGFEVYLVPTGITAAVRSPAGDLLYTLFKADNQNRVVCTPVTPESRTFCKELL